VAREAEDENSKNSWRAEGSRTHLFMSIKKKEGVPLKVISKVIKVI
jgi:hypothetical protein